MTTELILGPPGCGKTTALLDILDEELKRGTQPHRIGFVSFTRAAADVAATRAMERFNLERTDLPWFRTLHSLAYRVLGLHTNEVLAGKLLKDFSVWGGIQVTGRWDPEGGMNGYTEGDRILHMEHLARVRCLPLRAVYDEDDDGLPWSEVERVSRFFAAYKAARRLTDYTDMLLRAPAETAPPALDVLLADEVQDSSEAMWRTLDWLSRGVRRVVYAGDDDQAIYKWAGANVERLLSHSAPSRVLGQSHRVPRAVQAVASEVIQQVSRRRPKVWAARTAEGSVQRVADLSAADAETGEVLVLARNNFVIQEQVVPEMRRRGIYYSWDGRGPVEEETLAVIRTWERLRAGASVPVDEVLPVYAVMTSGRGYVKGMRSLKVFPDRTQPVTLADLRKTGGLLTDAIWHEALDRLPRDDVTFILAARRRGERTTGTPRVRLSTIHGAKGDEAENVILMLECAARTAREAERNPDDEARVFYVGVTRARERLTIVDTAAQHRYVL